MRFSSAGITRAAAGPVQACSERVADCGGTGPCALIGGGKANPIYAAFWPTALVRYVDFMDNFLTPTETCHTADNFGVVLAYTVQSRFVDHANFMTRGFDHTAELAFSLGAAAGRLLGLSEAQIANAIAMAAASDASFAVIRAKPLSQWKGLASSQSAIYCMIELLKRHPIDASKVVSIEADVTRIAYDFAGSGLYGIDKEVRTKEQADHNLPYLLAAALLDGDVTPAQFTPERIVRADVQTLLKKVSVRPNHEYSEEYPQKMPAKVTVRLQEGTTIEHEVQDYPGLASHPFTWEDEVAKFDHLVAGRIDDALSQEIKDAVRSLESVQVTDLMELLGRVRAPE